MSESQTSAVPFIGRGVDRVEARLKVTGQAPYAAEVEVAHVAHAVIVCSTIARGRLVSIDSAAAERVPGVLRILTPGNAPRLNQKKSGEGPTERVLQLLQDDRVLYQDQPIAVVIAETLESAQHAAALVAARYQAERSVAELTEDLASAYVPRQAGPSGPAESRHGDVEAGLRAAQVKIDASYTTPVEHHNPMEPHATIAVWQGDDHLTLYDSTQGIFGVRKRLAAIFSLKPEDVRVINHYVGGGFGCKGTPWSHVALCALCARVVGRGVKLVVTRPQMFALVGHRPKTVQRVVLGADREGRLSAIRHEVISETSRFDEFVEPCAVQTRMLYACPNIVTAHRLVRIDVPTPTFQRAPGEATGTFALESAMDELAYALRMDPLALRLRNHADSNPEDGRPWSSKSLRACYERGAAAFGWARRRPQVRAQRDGRALIGWGMATATYPARQQPSSAIARMRADGTALVQAGSQDIGTGTYTIMTQIAADALLLPMERVRFELGDTALPETPVSGGSMTASSTGSAVKMAGLALRQKLLELALADPRSPLRGLSADSVEPRAGGFAARGDAGKRDDYGAIVQRSGQPEVRAEFKTKPAAERERYATHAFGADFVEVRVDEELGEVRVTRFVGAFAAGKILNAKTARSQFIGGITWAIGLALTEHTERDLRSARVVTRDLADYHVPVCADVPEIEVIMVVEEDHIVNEIGAKGVGEIGITGAGAAIANAVYHATGTRVRDLPITPDKLL